MVTRRTMLGTAAVIGGGMAARWILTGREAAAQPTIVDPRFTAPVIDPLAIPKFVDPLPTPGGAWPVVMGTPIDFALKQLDCQILPQTAPGFPALSTPCWTYRRAPDTYTHTFLGPTIVAASGTPSNVSYDYSGVPTGQHLLLNGAGTQSVVDKEIHGTDDGEPEVRFIAHKHGGAGVDEDSDGYAEAWITPDGVMGPSFPNPYPTTTPPATHHHLYPNEQGAGLAWYHDHALGITRLNVFAGMAGGYVVTDANEQALIASGALPSLGGPFDVPLVIQDRMFYPDGRLAYPDQPAPSVVGCEPWPGGPSTLPEFFGDVILVNGKTWPFLEVEPAIYRLRFLNGCNSRFLSLQLAPSLAFTILGTEGGFLPGAVGVRELILGPAERFDVLVDFGRAAGKTVTLTNRGAKKPFPKGTPPNPKTDGLVIEFRVKSALTVPAEVTAPLPAVINPTPPPGTLTASVTRRVLLFEGVDEFGRIQPMLGTVDDALQATPLMWDDPVTETPAAGSVETWEIYNTTADSHPIHIHEIFFSVVNRQGINFRKQALAMACDAPPPTFTLSVIGRPKAAPAYERGFKDTVITYPGEVTRIRVDYRDATPGRFVWHCHILEHEDHEMMRPYDVV